MSMTRRRNVRRSSGEFARLNMTALPAAENFGSPVSSAGVKTRLRSSVRVTNFSGRTMPKPKTTKAGTKRRPPKNVKYGEVYHLIFPSSKSGSTGYVGKRFGTAAYHKKYQNKRRNLYGLVLSSNERTIRHACAKYDDWYEVVLCTNIQTDAETFDVEEQKIAEYRTYAQGYNLATGRHGVGEYCYGSQAAREVKEMVGMQYGILTV